MPELSNFMTKEKYTPELLARLKEAALNGASLEELVEMSGAGSASGLMQSIRLKLKETPRIFPRDKLREYWSEWRYKRKGKPVKLKTKNSAQEKYQKVVDHLPDLIALILERKPSSIDEIRRIMRNALKHLIKIGIQRRVVAETLEEYITAGWVASFRCNEKYQLIKNPEVDNYLRFLHNRTATSYNQIERNSPPYPVDRTLINPFLDYLANGN